MKKIISLSNVEAKNFFLKSESYVNIDLPPYFDFSELLTKTNNIMNSKLSDFYKNKPSNYEKVNYHLYSNKNGKYSWRPLQIINPAIYVEITSILTEENNWKYIIEKFKQFQKNPNIKCMSIPVISKAKKKDKAEQIMLWWEQIEQESLKLALKFNYLIHTDINNCYGSIYTHTISWALHGKEVAKKKRKDKKLLGNKIDECIQSMNYGQTNGIPQGSVLSDFIAEIILGYIDLELSNAIKVNGIKEYKILRYRDDYRIFVRELNDGEKILKLLSEILLEFNFKLDDKKTRVESDIILSSIKDNKLAFFEINKSYSSIQKELLVLYKFSKTYPNSGSLANWLTSIYKKTKNKKRTLKNREIEVLISILTEIMYKNPRVISLCIAIISIILKDLNDKDKKSEIIRNIINKFSVIPNIGLLEIWLQRLTYPIDKNHQFNDELCKKVLNKEHTIWNIDWISNESLKIIIKTTDFIRREKLDNLDKIINRNEFDIFSY
ncbi:MAG TPA: RNA-directed DNA polymerase [Exilispira sp.]|nr:RNA-directed DNA polymerase [Exilispira sp.]